MSVQESPPPQVVVTSAETTLTDDGKYREEIYQQILHYINCLKNNSIISTSHQQHICNLILSNVDYLLYDWHDLTDDLVQVWMNGTKSNSSVLTFIIWLLSVYSFLSHEYPIHTQMGILKWVVELKLKTGVLDQQKECIQRLQVPFKYPCSSLMIGFCSEHFFNSNHTEPSWLKHLRTNISLQAKLDIAFLNMFNHSKHLLETSDFVQIVHSLVKFGQHDLAMNFLDRKIATIDSQYSQDVGFCYLWQCGILLDTCRNNSIDLHRIPFIELEFFIKEVIFTDGGLLFQKNQSSGGKIVQIPKNLFHLFEDATLPQQFMLGGPVIDREHLELLVGRLTIAFSHLRNGGLLRIALTIYHRLVEYYEQVPNSEHLLDDLHKQCSILHAERKEGIEYLSKCCRYYHVSVMISSERREEYIYRAYHFENIDTLIERRILVDFPNCTIINARNLQISDGSIRILPAFEEKPNCFIVYDYQREEDGVFPDDDKIFGCSISRCFIGDIDIFPSHVIDQQLSSLIILKAKIISSISVFDQVNQMQANYTYLNHMDKYIKRISQMLAHNIVNGVTLTNSATCYGLFLCVGNLIHDVMEGGKLDYILGLNQCKQLIYCYKGIYRDELADRKKEIRRRWMKERKFATENKLELPPEPSLTNLIEHNEEFLKLKDSLNQLLDSINQAFILYKELGSATYKNYQGVTETLERIQILNVQTLSLLSELPSVIDELSSATTTASTTTEQ